MNNNQDQISESNSSVGVYKATSNLNTAMENPNMDVSSATSVNIQDNQIYNNSAFNSNNSNVTSFNVSSDINVSNIDDDIVKNKIQNTILSNSNSFENNNVINEISSENYEPVYEKKEVESTSSKKGILNSRELKLVVFISFSLFIFILLLPYLFDWFNKLILTIGNNR